MLLYLDLVYDDRKSAGTMATLGDLREAVTEAAVRRVRPIMMTVLTTFVALVPILWATGAGADVMKRIAAPMVGGLVTVFLGVLFVFPAMYFVWRSFGLAQAGSIREESSLR